MSQIGYEAQRGVSFLGEREYFSGACKTILLRDVHTISKLLCCYFFSTNAYDFLCCCHFLCSILIYTQILGLSHPFSCWLSSSLFDNSGRNTKNQRLPPLHQATTPELQSAVSPPLFPGLGCEGVGPIIFFTLLDVRNYGMVLLTFVFCSSLHSPFLFSRSARRLQFSYIKSLGFLRLFQFFGLLSSKTLFLWLLS